MSRSRARVGSCRLRNCELGHGTSCQLWSSHTDPSSKPLIGWGRPIKASDWPINARRKSMEQTNTRNHKKYNKHCEGSTVAPVTRGNVTMRGPDTRSPDTWGAIVAVWSLIEPLGEELQKVTTRPKVWYFHYHYPEEGMNGLMDGWTDGEINGWLNKSFNHHFITINDRHTCPILGVLADLKTAIPIPDGLFDGVRSETDCTL